MNVDNVDGMDVETVIQEERSRQIYAELLCDFMFKRVFGSEENKDVLIAFLNVMLEDVKIKDVTFIPTEQLGDSEEDRTVIFDVSCQCTDGRTFIIEMQKGYQKYFRDRALFYTTYPINKQGKLIKKRHEEENSERTSKGLEKKDFKWDYRLDPVIVVAILNFSFDHNDDWPQDRYHSSYRIREDITGEVMTENLRFVFMELGRFRKKVWELESVYDKWMFALKHIHELAEKPAAFHEAEFERLFLLAKIGNFTAEEYKHYITSLKHMSDYYNIIDTAVEAAEKRGLEKGRAEGREEGMAEGIEKGMENGKREVACKLMSMGMSDADIIVATGLTADELAELKTA